jgi:hypothetical protein
MKIRRLKCLIIFSHFHYIVNEFKNQYADLFATITPFYKDDRPANLGG